MFYSNTYLKKKPTMTSCHLWTCYANIFLSSNESVEDFDLVYCFFQSNLFISYLIKVKATHL